MPRRRSSRSPWVPLIVLTFALLAYAGYSLLPQHSPAREPSFVTKIVDGDTIVIEGGQRVRLLSIDTRERGQNCYTEASDRLADLILYKNITLERDIENQDQYQRLLRYVYVANQSINLQMVEEGWAVAYIYEPNVKYRSAFLDAERAARTQGGCIWTTRP